VIQGSIFHQQRRCQQQLAAAAVTTTPSAPHEVASVSTESEKRVVMQMFLESLRLAADLTTPAMSRSSVIQKRNRILLLEEHWQQQWRQQSIKERLTQPQKQEPWQDAIKQIEDGVQKVNESESDSTMEFPQKELVGQLHTMIKRHRANEALHVFQNAIKEDEDFVFSSKITSDLFFLLSTRHQVGAYQVLQYYNKHHANLNGGKWMPMYRRICTSIRDMTSKSYNSKDDVYQFVSSLLREIEDMTLEEQQTLYPNLIVSLVLQRRVFVGRFAHHAYDAMVDRGLTMEMGWLIKLLATSKYNRQDDLPFHDVLSRLVAMGATPHSTVVMPAIHNMFPYTDTKRMHVALQALVDLESTKKNASGRPPEPPEYENDRHRIDMSTLEMISNSAAKVGDATLILLVWDLLDVSGYDPTETIFENTILTFASQPNGLHRAFVALESMKEFGLLPTRALIRSFSYLIRADCSTIDDGLEILLQSRKEGNVGSLLSLESLNVIMSGYAERGHTEQALEMLKIMEENNIQPNEDSFSFAIEVLGKDIHRRSLMGDTSHVHRNLEFADLILTRMEEKGVEPSTFVVRQYVELLCQTGEIETATSVVDGCLSDDDNRATIVCNKSLYRVALANADRGNFEKAKELAGKMSEEVPVLHRKIRSKEQRHIHVKSVEKRMAWQTILD
jgi:pentatricopeptide repeat protein